ncbi:MAG: transcriptional regulator [Bacteroidetes bacterium]|nr:transcriptional regulator [Bacteroidota bacterium]
MKSRNNIPEIEKVLSANRIIHEPARMVILSLLSVVEEADFLFLINQTGLTQGNLSSHISKLENAGFIDVIKTFRKKRPRTILRLTTEGGKKFRSYLDTMQGFFYNILTG